MKLDWEPLATPKRGHEQEFADLFRKLLTSTGAKRDRVFQWFVDVAVPPFESVGAPRVGFDAEADAWLVARVEKSGRLHELDEIRAEMRGYHVLALLPPCEGFPVYSNSRISDDLERYAFDASQLLEARDVLGEELCARATTPMLADAHLAFGEQLLEVATRFARDEALPEHVATIREPVFPEGSKERTGHVLFAAAKWCVHWARGGHGLWVVA